MTRYDKTCGICGKPALFELLLHDKRDWGYWSGNYCKKHVLVKLKQVTSEIQHIADKNILSMRGILKDGKVSAHHK